MSDRLLAAWGVDPRHLRALVAAFVTMDLRGQHFARANGMKPDKLEVISPLFWVVGQCLTLSAATSLFLFARVDVWFFAFANLTVGLLVLATTLLVEFQEVVTDPRDLEIIGHRPVDSTTYAAARFANLGFYVVLMGTALHLIPLIVGAGLRDAGWWYAPAYLIAALGGSLIVVALVIGVMTLAGGGGDRLKDILAWTQIVLILVVGYGGQLMLRDGTAAVQVWAAFPPAWVEWLPPTWLARFVEQAAIAPTFATFGIGVGILALGLVSATAAIGQVGRMYARMQPARVNARPRPLPAGQLGGVGGWLTRWLGGPTPEGRVGFWLARNMLKRDGDLAMRCLLPFASPVAVMALALGSGQCGNPLVERDPQRIVLPILVVGLMALAVPPVVYNLTFSRDHAAAWQILAAPLASPGAYGRGAARAAWLATVLPLSLLFVVTASIAWGDPLSALLHGGLAVLMAWPLTLAALALMVPDLPFSRPTVRGGAFAPIALPMVVLGSAVMLVAGGHLVFGGTIGFWLGTVIGCVVVALVMGPRADARMRRLFRGGR